MQFHDYLTHYQIARNTNRRNRMLQELSPREFFLYYCKQLDAIARAQHGKPLEEVDPFTPNLLQHEADWHELERPYYNLWPSIIPALSKLRLDADAEHFTLPLDTLLLRFPVQQNPLRFSDRGQEYSVRAVLASNVRLYSGEKGRLMKWTDEEPEDYKRGIAFWIDCGEPVDPSDDSTRRLSRMMYKHLVCEPGKSIEWSFDHIPAHESTGVGVRYPEPLIRDIARIVCTLCLMADDSEIVEPIVLRADEERFSDTHDMTLVDRAKRRGNYGFNVGRSVEVMPHVRSASPAALYWTGEGRKIPKIRFRRGAVVHRKKLASMPTGFLDKENVE